MFYVFFNPTASATAYGQRPKFVRAKHSTTAEGENCTYSPKLICLVFFQQNNTTLKSLLPHCDKSSEVKLHNNDDDDRNYTFLMQKSFANDLRNSTEMQNKRQIHTELLLLPLPLKATLTILQFTSL